MAKVYSYQGDGNWPAIVEDPRANNDGFYFYGNRHDKTSLTPQFNSRLNFSNSGGYSESSYFYAYATTNYERYQHLSLNKLTVHLPQWYTTSDSYINNIPDDSAWRHMDENEPSSVGGLRVYQNTDGSKKAFGFWGGYSTSEAYVLWNNVPGDSTYLHETRPNSYSTGSSYFIDFIGVQDSEHNGYVFGSRKHTSNFYPSYQFFAKGSGFPASWTGSYDTSFSGMTTYWGIQLLGKSSVDGEMMWAGCYSYGGTESNEVKIVKTTRDGDGYPTQTVVHEVEGDATVTAAGTHQGGNNMNGVGIWHTYSKTFDDPRAAGKKCFYKAWFDSYGDFHPLLTTWTLSDDTFVTETDISITGDKSTAHASLVSHTTDTGNTHHGSPIVCEQFYSGSTRYVGYFPLDCKQKYSAEDGFKNFIIYSVDAADPKSLTYHSKLTLPETARNLIWLNDDRTLMGLFFKTTFKMYAWNDVSGWTETSVIGDSVHAIGRDSLDRIWYTTKTNAMSASYADINLLSPTLPVTVNITPELSSYSYGGSNITSYIDVSALNASGARIATNVRLVIEGSSMTFTDGSTTKTVTTLTTGDLQVGTVVTGAGYTNVTASIEL